MAVDSHVDRRNHFIRCDTLCVSSMPHSSCTLHNEKYSCLDNSVAVTSRSGHLAKKSCRKFGKEVHLENCSKEG